MKRKLLSAALGVAKIGGGAKRKEGAMKTATFLRNLGTAVAMTAAMGLAHAGSRSLGDLTPGSANSFGLDYNAVFPGAYLDGLTYFAIGCQLWKTDGTPLGTLLVSDLSSGACTIRGLLAVNGGLLFIHGSELWRSDGTAGGTGVLSVPGFSATITSSSGLWPGRPGLAYFIVYGASQYEVWGTDGSVAGTSKLASGGSVATVAFMPDVPHTMAILDNGLWSAITTTSATSISTAFTYSNFNAPTPVAFGSNLLFTGSEATHGLEPWVSDFTNPGTKLLKDVTVGSGDTSNVAFGPVLNGQLFFKAYDYLWKTDGTPIGTVQLTSPGAVIVQPEIALAGNQVVFPGQQGDGKFYWWRSDGSMLGTAALSATPINSNGSDPVVYFSQRKNDALYCTFSPYTLTRLTGQANDFAPVGGCSGLLADERRNLGDIELAATNAGLDVLRDGKPRVTNLAFPPSSSSQTHPGLPGGPMFYFAQSTVTTGREPWSMDLTDADAPACSYPGKTVPDADTGGRTDTLYFPQTIKAGKLRVYLDIPHTFIGDLSATLTHVESGKTVQLFTRPGVPATTFGCPSNDLDVVLDDSAGTAIGTGCAATTDAQAYAPGTALSPLQPLATFAGDNLTGTWQLKVVDNRAGDVGGIDRWCVQNVDRLFFDDFQ